MSIPQFITHYYLPETGPLKSLSDLSRGVEDPVFENFLQRHKHDPSYRRRYGKSYLKRRKVVEDRLRDAFILRGGKPKRQHPFYFVLGNSPWFKGLNEGQCEFRVNLSDLPPESVSITFPDSLITFTAEEKPYYNQVFLVNEIDKVVAEYGIPSTDQLWSYERYWEGDFELYIEVQVWEQPENIRGRKICNYS